MSNEIVKHQNHATQFNFFDPAAFQTIQRVCTMFASSELVPAMYRVTQDNPKEKAIANCMIALETANRIGASPLMVMQNMYIVHGQPAWSAKFLTATVNGCGRYNSIKYRLEQKGTLKWDNKDVENWECIAYTSEKGSDEVLESIPVDIAMAIKEGWYGKKGSKWQTMPKLMLQYRAVTFWTRAYAPELSMGIKPEDEIRDIQDIPYEEVTDKVKLEVKENANKATIGFDDHKNGTSPDPKPSGDPASEKSEDKKPEIETKEEGPGY